MSQFPGGRKPSSFASQPSTAIISSPRSASVPRGGPGLTRTTSFTMTLQNGQKVQAEIEVSQKQVMAAPAVVVHASFLIDASASMSSMVPGAMQSRMGTVLKYLKELVSNVLVPTDRLTLTFFNKSNKQVSVLLLGPSNGIDDYLASFVLSNGMLVTGVYCS